MTRVPLNVFQRTQRLWETFAPYNAAQVMHVVRNVDLTRAQAAWTDTLQALGLGLAVTDGETYGFHEAGATTTLAPVKVLPASDADRRPAVERLMDYVTREMNRPFAIDQGTTRPLRPFVIEGETSHHLGVVYQHWVADSVSVRLLMREWLLRTVGLPARHTRPLRLARGGLWRHFGPGRAGWSLVSTLIDTVAFAPRMKRARRVEISNASQDVRVHYRRLPDGLIEPLKHAARQRGATVGDVFTAAAVMACARHGPTHPTKRRPDLAFGSIVDLRGRSKAVPDDVFGLFLGFIQTAFARRELTTFDTLLRAAAKQSKAARGRHLAEAGQVRMAVGSWIARRLKPQRLLEFYRKRFPLSGGLSSVNLAGTWQTELHPAPLLEYLRVSPTGPLMPVVFTPTTLGDSLHVCCTVRSALIDDASAQRLIDAFCEKVAGLAK